MMDDFTQEEYTEMRRIKSDIHLVNKRKKLYSHPKTRKALDNLAYALIVQYHRMRYGYGG